MAKRNDSIKNTLIPEERSQIIELYQKCPPGYHVDHIKPISKGGTHTLDNLQYLLAEENLKKGNRY
jgi:5-methylcytosine-specific restriction endonuclease McrA